MRSSTSFTATAINAGGVAVLQCLSPPAVAGDAVRVTEGNPSVFPTSETGRSHFCGKCGTGLYGEFLAPTHLLARNGRYFSIRVGTFDEPERLRPQIHQWIESKLSWFDTTDDLPRVEGNTLPHPDKRKR
jgi:hypothetical protein